MKPTLYVILIALLIISPPAYADNRNDIRDASIEYAKPLESIMVDGPFYVEDLPYYMSDFVKPDSTIAASIIFDPNTRTPISEPELIKKVLATKDLKKLTVADPPFYAPGDPSNIIKASKYETENVRNFASFSSLTPEESNILEVFLSDYENLMQKVAEVSSITESILYPEGSLEIKYIISPPSMTIKVNENKALGHFSYEGFRELVDAYGELYREHLRFSADLSAFAGGLPEYAPGEIIREKWEVEITKEAILEEVRLVDENGQRIQSEIDLRREILSYGYESQLDEINTRLGINQRPRLISKILGVVSGFKNFLLGIFGLGLLLIGGVLNKPPKKPVLTFLIILTILISPVLSQSLIDPDIPTMDEIISQKVEEGSLIHFQNNAEGLNESTAKEILIGFPLMLKDETVTLSGPYYYYQRPYYYIDIQKDNESTGHGFLVDASNFRLVGDQRQAYKLLKTLVFADYIKKNPLYIGQKPEFIHQSSMETLESPLDLFLFNLSKSVEHGIELENALLEKPDFEILLNLTENYVESFILIQNINQLIPLDESKRLTGGFSKNVHLLDAYSRANRGLASQEYLAGRIAQYRGRTLNRLPLISSLSSMGLSPSKAQVTHDLTSDLVYDNPYIWRLGTNTNPALFTRLAFKEGTFTIPKSVPNSTTPENQ